jgi:hypothetical protein
MLFFPVFFHFFMEQFSFLKDVSFSVEGLKTRNAEMNPTMAAANHSLKYLPVSIEPTVEGTPGTWSFCWLWTMENVIVVQSVTEFPFQWI